MTLGNGYAISTWVFLRWLAVLYAIAFLSLALQIRGLVGTDGIMPARVLRQAQRRGSLGSFSRLPTLSRLTSSDAALVAQCWAGLGSAIVLLAGGCPPVLLLVCWGLYVSLTNACGAFLGYQWDALLTEMGLLAILIAPPVVWSGAVPVFDPPAAARWLLIWLLFRLMFSSGVAKLRSGDPSWRDLSALRFHYETQPLPNALSWYAHALPASVHRVTAAAMFVLEILAPFLLLAGPPFAYAGAAGIAALMIAIEATGNFAFFNLQTMALCVLAFDDGVWGPLVPQYVTAGSLPVFDTPLWWTGLVGAVAVALFALSWIPMLQLFIRGETPRGRLGLVMRRLAAFRIVNGYGLFAVMTTRRPEIIVEGSNDGEVWRPYEFRWKPGDPNRRPRVVAPHQPRLDWQMWFAALGGLSTAAWFRPFLQRLLEGSPYVLGLLAKDPFEGKPPAHVRALLYEYRFTSKAERVRTGAWWARELVGVYYPAVSRAEDAE